MAICYLIGAGEFAEKIEMTDSDIMIAADGGFDALIQHGYTPDLIIGDFDSINSSLPNNLEIIRHPKEKDETDMLLAYLEGAKRGYTKFVIHGALGGRLDHTLANISLLAYIKNNGHSAEICGKEQSIICIKNEEITLCGTAGKYVSVFAFGNEAHGVCIKGAKYEADNITLVPDFPLGVSNELTDSACKISVTDGILIVVYENS